MFLNIVLITSIVISLLASLSVYFQRKEDSYLKLFVPFLLATLLVECISSFDLLSRRNANIMYNFFGSTVEFTFYFFILGEIIRNKRVKRIIRWVLWIYLPVALANIIFIQKLTGFPSLTYNFACLFIVTICIYYFFELFQLTQSVVPTRRPSFWICSGLLFFYCCSFPIFGPLNIVGRLPHVFLENLAKIIVVLNVLLYSSFTIAFLCRFRTRNSTSSS